jgi:hypothetical protein
MLQWIFLRIIPTTDHLVCGFHRANLRPTKEDPLRLTKQTSFRIVSSTLNQEKESRMRVYSVRKIAALFVLVAIVSLKAQNRDQSYFPGPSFYGTGIWNSDSLGNHRVVIMVNEKGDAVVAHVPWRRRDHNPEQKGVYVFDASSGKRILNVACMNINRESGDIVFQPTTVPGNYYIYYLLYRAKGVNYPKGYYLPMEQTADRQWMKIHSLEETQNTASALPLLPEADLVQFQSIDEFNSFYPMEVIATKAELEHLLKMNRRATYLVFPEDRKDPIKMTTDLPAKWIMDGPRSAFGGFAHKGEFYAFQLGIYAARERIDGLDISVTDLRRTDGGVIPSSSFSSFNTEGTDWQGREFHKSVTVEKGEVQALWMGLQVPKDAPFGTYQGVITIAPQGLKPTKVKIRLDVSDMVLADGGDGEPYRLTRLRWLNSQLAADDSIVRPFIPMTVQDNVVACLGRSLAIDPSGFPQSIVSNFSQDNTSLSSAGRQLLAAPIRMILENSKGQVESWKNHGFEITKRASGLVAWKSESSAGPVEV